MQLKFIPIESNMESIEKYLANDFCNEVYYVYEQLYLKIGFHLPWVGYFVFHQNEIIGVGGYKGPPINNSIEVAYGVVPEKEGQGFATEICNKLILTALRNNPGLRVSARTLMEENASTSILRKNHFKYVGIVEDPEDGKVWEWQLENKLI